MTDSKSSLDATPHIESALLAYVWPLEAMLFVLESWKSEFSSDFASLRALHLGKYHLLEIVVVHVQFWLRGL